MNQAAYTSRSLHAMAHLLGMDDSAYRDLLRDNYGVASSKELSNAQLQALGRSLQSQLHSNTNRKRFSDLKPRPNDKATPAQIRAIEAMWMTVSNRPTTEEKRQALNAMCHRITGIQSVRWISKRNAQDLIKAIQSMGAQTPEQYNRSQNQNKEASHG